MKEHEEWAKEHPVQNKIRTCLILGVFAFCIWVVFLTNNYDSPSSDSSSSDENTAMRTYCSSLTNTYQKCSYSIWEDRCVCKDR